MEKNNQIQLIQEQSFSLPDEAKHITVIDDESLKNANDFYQVCKKIIEHIHDYMDPIKKATHKAWKESIAQTDRLEELPLKAMKMVKPKMIAYKEKVLEEIRKAEKEAQDKIDAEKKEAEELLETAADLEKEGEEELADEVFEQAEAKEEEVKESTLKMKEIPVAPKTEGTIMRKIPKWKMIKFADVPHEYLKEEIERLDSVKIGRVVRAASGKIKIPGIEVYFETV